MKALLGQLYAFAFVTDLTYWGQFKRSTWVQMGAWLPFLLSAVCGLRWQVTIGLLSPPLLVWLAYKLARRSGYITFAPTPLPDPVLPGRLLRPAEKIAVRATGLFSVLQRERYLVEKKADYWYVPVGEHVLMVEETPGRYLYQFVNVERMIQRQMGLLYLGSTGRPAIKIVFRTDWIPNGAGEMTAYFFRPDTEENPTTTRTIYLSFDQESDQWAVWRRLHTNE